MLTIQRTRHPIARFLETFSSDPGCGNGLYQEKSFQLEILYLHLSPTARSPAALRPVAHQRRHRGRPVRAHLGRHHREPAAVADDPAQRPELHLHLPNHEHAAGRGEGNELRAGHAP